MNTNATPTSLTPRARRLRREQTHCESLLWARLRRRVLDGCKFQRQFVLGPYIVDFVCLDERLIIEVAGGQHDPAEPDEAARTRWLQSQSVRVLRFWNSEVDQNLEGVLDTIHAVLSDETGRWGGRPLTRSLRSHPLPRGERVNSPLPFGRGRGPARSGGRVRVLRR